MTTPRLRVLVIGAGIGGLTAAIGLKQDGHEVIVLEAAEKFGEVGAGMRIPPNCFKILHRWGVDFTYMKKTYSNGNRFLRYSDGHTLANVPHGVPELDFGGSYLMVHRADYHSRLLERAQKLGVDIQNGKKVVSYNWSLPAAQIQDGTWLEADLLVAADGVQSVARALFVGHDSPPTDTGDIVYRILLPGSALLDDPDLRDLVSQPWVSSWCGPDAHFIGYPIRGGEIYNIVACCKADTVQDAQFIGAESKVSVDSNVELLRRFSGWEPRIQKLIHLADKTKFLKWRLYDLESVDKWVHPSGKAILLGDACHPMLPYMSQGAAQACEDAAVLKNVLNGSQDLQSALNKYQDIRRPRAAVIQKAGRALQYTYHLHDGSEQEERDILIREDRAENPIFWAHSARQEWLFGYDVDAETEAARN